MQIRPILATLRYHKAGTLLIALQIALTLAIVCNALFIIHQRLGQLSRPSGVDESDLLLVHNQWAGKPDADEVASMMASDLATLRNLPGVANVYATNTYPLSGEGTVFGIGHSPDKKTYTDSTAIYFVDDNALATLGLRLIAGRNFRPDEIGASSKHSKIEPDEIIITQALAHHLFPDASAVGKAVYLSRKPSIIIGVVGRMRTPWVDSSMAKWDEYSTLLPYRRLEGYTEYVIRTQPGQLDDVARRVKATLYAANRMRVISPKNGVRTFADVGAQAYNSDRGMAILMGAISLIMLTITGAGIVGLTSFWVGQRRKQIGVRRALGATQRDILSYFLTENLLIGVAGVIVGGVLAIGLNLWLMNQFEMEKLAMGYVVAGVAILLVLGQGAVLAPALRASKVPPVEATRSV
ncbi:peptide ABC transporter permease [Dyella monticola]|uniref:Peptide ABC transporter permease n=1 Tax=Dyella monticola TaxID=1927958 RepID=A0A370X3M9_9GAMM|nr:FtsX-like permease family protein [Dyella monticola]RDS83024.1 peptide ABC transporter permease [Dyella monticola]